MAQDLSEIFQKVLSTTVEEGNREISRIQLRLQTNDKVFIDLKTSLVNCIKKANTELEALQQTPREPDSVKHAVYWERETVHYDDK